MELQRSKTKFVLVHILIVGRHTVFEAELGIKNMLETFSKNCFIKPEIMVTPLAKKGSLLEERMILHKRRREWYEPIIKQQ